MNFANTSSAPEIFPFSQISRGFLTGLPHVRSARVINKNEIPSGQIRPPEIDCRLAILPRVSIYYIFAREKYSRGDKVEGSLARRPALRTFFRWMPLKPLQPKAYCQNNNFMKSGSQKLSFQAAVFANMKNMLLIFVKKQRFSI